jgi:hypothetical protein
LDGSIQIISLDLKFPGDLAAFPVGLAAVAHQKFQRGFSRKEGVVLAEVPDAEPGMADDFSGIQLFLAEDATQEGRFAGTVAADETHLGVGRQGAVGTVQEDLIAIAFIGVSKLQQYGHTVEGKEGKV